MAMLILDQGIVSEISV
uniref:Uncharacterized protein n=1 Tax=Anguilla anguilla TaxID=7936 RepID=A0A0E9P9R4_ANGAN